MKRTATVCGSVYIPERDKRMLGMRFPPEVCGWKPTARQAIDRRDAATPQPCVGLFYLSNPHSRSTRIEWRNSVMIALTVVLETMASNRSSRRMIWSSVISGSTANIRFTVVFSGGRFSG